MPSIKLLLTQWIIPAPLCIWAILVASPEPAFAQSNAFIYNGKLNLDGSPANGAYAFTFTLFGATNGGSPLAGTTTNSLVPVTNGFFSTTVGFTTNVFTGQNVWLEIAVATNGGANFTVLNPRQPVVSAPYAIYAYSVSAANVTGTLPSSALPDSFKGSFSGSTTGTFTGTIEAGSVVPDSALSADVSLNNLPLSVYATNGGIEHTLWSSGTGNGSTLSLKHWGATGYADVNFMTAPDYSQMVGNPTLRFALGAASFRPNGQNSDVYTSPYLEMYSGESFWFINYGNWYGGVRGGKFNFVWFRNGQTNTPMFEIDRASNTITNYSPTVFVSPPTLQTTNLPPSGITWGVTPPDTWITITNNGQPYLIPAFKK